MDAAFRRAVAEAREHGDLYFAGLLPEDRILEAFGSARWFWQGWIYTPAVTVWVFLAQCLSSDHSCREAVARLIGWRLVRGLRPWLEYVATPQTDVELLALRRSVERGVPYGNRWQAQAIAALGLEGTLRPRGRPRKSNHEA